jgi:tRNA1(Val) A37 N6-methylase TrmN6
MIFEYNGMVCCAIAQDLEELALIKSNLLESAGILSGVSEKTAISGIIDVLRALEFTADQYADIEKALKDHKCVLQFETNM